MSTKGPDLTRRRFLSTSLTGLAAAGLAGIGPGLASAQEEEKAPRERGLIVMMDDVVVNLRDGDATRFLKVSTGLEFSDKKLESEITERMPELRDLLINHLSSHQVEDVVHSEGREIVKRQLLADFNDRLQNGQLINIYFSDFVVQ